MAIRELPFGLGLIEGFYGREWQGVDRLDCLRFLGGCGYQYYVYAPKSDVRLRGEWQEPWSSQREQSIRDIAHACRDAGLAWGVGLSPLGLVEAMPSGLSQLRRKISYLNRFDADLLCILFDDMPRGEVDIAAMQLNIVNEVLEVTQARHVLVCPSYYSSDPVLERLFGSMPPEYWASLGQGLPAEVGVFWTGEKVCSTSYGETGLQAIAQSLQRRPVLWDNYPVNDGARMAGFLHLNAFEGRSAQLAQLTQAHFVNPMNQCWLSRIPLATLPQVYHEDGSYAAQQAFRRSAIAQCGERLGQMLCEDLPLFQQLGLEGMSDGQKQQLRERYAQDASPFAGEIRQWLDGEYAFDPACLTG